jgi:hypothetical protein
MQYAVLTGSGIPEATDPPDLPYLFSQAVVPLDGYMDQYLRDWGYANVPVRSGFAWQSATPMRVRRIGKQVSAFWGISSSGVVADGVARIVADIPSDYRPVSTGYFNWIGTNPAVNARGIIYSSGTVEIVVPVGTTVSAYYLLPLGLSWLVD